MLPIIPSRYYYPRCDNLNEPSRSYCRGYIDQCVAQRRTKGEGSSNFELVSDHGKRSTGLKFAECLQLSPTYAAHGKAKGAESQPSQKPLPPQDARPAGQDVMPGQYKAQSDQSTVIQTPPPATSTTVPQEKPWDDFGDKDHYKEALEEERKSLNRDERRYVALVLLEGVASFDMDLTDSFVSDEYVIKAWREKPLAVLDGLDAFFKKGNIDKNPANHPNTEEWNALLVLYNFLKLTAEHSNEDEIPTNEFQRVTNIFRYENNFYTGTNYGGSAYLALLARSNLETDFGTLPSAESIKSMRKMGCLNPPMRSVLNLKKKRAKAAGDKAKMAEVDNVIIQLGFAKPKAKSGNTE